MGKAKNKAQRRIDDEVTSEKQALMLLITVMAQEEARGLIMSGMASAMADDSMNENAPQAVSLAGYLLNYYGDRKYQDEKQLEQAEAIAEMLASGIEVAAGGQTQLQLGEDEKVAAEVAVESKVKPARQKKN